MNIKEIKELVKILDGTDISEFSLETEGNKINIKRGSSIAYVNQPIAPIIPVAAPGHPIMPDHAGSSLAPAASTGAKEKNEGLAPNQVLISAPMVGTFYRAPSPEAQPYVQVGQIIEAGHVVCIIEAMKLMNEIESENSGKIVEVLVENAQPVEYGQPLFVLEKN
ncbi:MAG TPA: acetyl-CoA carboxylase biotin carboxyl carrier protein [Bacillota bacterium]|nr:acetyl-CoA carboxylase biotin carboxyl carrier protein [Bacillota bacterium]